MPPAVPELGNSSGFDLELEDRGSLGHDRLMAARNQLLALAAKDPLLSGVRPNNLDDTPQLHLDIDQDKATALGLVLADINTTFATAWGGLFINNFVDRGRVKRVYMQGDAPFRMRPEDLDRWYVRSVDRRRWRRSPPSPQTDWTVGPAQLERYNGLPSLEIQGQSGAGPELRHGDARDGEAVRRSCRTASATNGPAFPTRSSQSGAQAPSLYALSMLVVFLCLAALYESWSIPLSVMLVIPLGVIGAVLAATLRGLYNDIYFQVGLLDHHRPVRQERHPDRGVRDVAETRGRRSARRGDGRRAPRLRPILMTSLAFIAGVLPLAIAIGRGRGQPERHRHRRGRRHAHGDRAGDLLRAAVLRGRAALGAGAAAPAGRPAARTGVARRAGVLGKHRQRRFTQIVSGWLASRQQPVRGMLRHAYEYNHVY